MKRRDSALAAILTLSPLLFACGGSDESTQDAGTGSTNSGACAITEDGASAGVVSVPSTLSAFQSDFCRAAKVDAANGQPIWIVAQSTVREEQLLRAKNVLSLYLTNTPGTKYGADKSAVSNIMAARGAVLTLFDGRDDGNNPAAEKQYGEHPTQPLFAGEIFVEGDAQYQRGGADEDPRDASFEEILHFVHDNGIGVDGDNALGGPLKDSYQKEIRARTVTAIKEKLWPMDQDWLAELTQENSQTQEYLASLNDAYWGLTAGDRGDAQHKAKTRTELVTLDPEGKALIEMFLPEYLSYTARIDPNFEGVFSMSFDKDTRYTNKSQWLLSARLLGDKDSGLKGNAQDNVFYGNSGDNSFDGAAGEDTVHFTGKKEEYTITASSGRIMVTDSETDRDGSDTLVNVENIAFSDQTVKTSGLGD